MSDAPGLRTIRIPPDDVGRRLDRVLSERLGLSRTRVQRLVEGGHVRVHDVGPNDADKGWIPRKSEVVHEGWVVDVEVPPAEPVELVAQDLPLTIVFEDDHIAVVDKPAGMVVHPAPGHRDGTLVNALLHHLGGLSGVGGRLRPGIVHRLDRDTSGLLVVAKTDTAHRALSAALSRRGVRRIYRAACWGHLPDPEITIDAPVGRDPRQRKRMAVVEDGRSALTRVHVSERWPAADILDVQLGTGRTHQIRVHLAHVGHPVVGDAVYGLGWERGMDGPIRSWAREFARRVPRQFLHATHLAFDHPVSGERLHFDAALPADLGAALAWARGSQGEGPA